MLTKNGKGQVNLSRSYIHVENRHQAKNHTFTNLSILITAELSAQHKKKKLTLAIVFKRKGIE